MAQTKSPAESLTAILTHEKNPIKRFFKMLGPGLVTGASDDDPSGIGTYAQAGAALGFSALWTALAILVVQIWGSYRLIARIFTWLTLSLFAYILSAFFARPDWWDVVRGTFVPTLRFDSRFLTVLLAILGTTITPYLFFWQANQE